VVSRLIECSLQKFENLLKQKETTTEDEIEKTRDTTESQYLSAVGNEGEPFGTKKTMFFICQMPSFDQVNLDIDVV
jgi:hypothetical protein